MATETKTGALNNQLEADALVLTGAAIVGIKDGVKEVAENKVALAKKMLEPGDQLHIAHPLDDLVADTKNLVSDISHKVEAAYSAGDMNIRHSQDRQPHLIDKAMQARDDAIATTADTLLDKGLVEGTRTASAIAASVATENLISPSGKGKAIQTALDVTGDAKVAGAAMNALPIDKEDLSHLTMLPQIPSSARIDKMYELSDAGKDVELVKMQMSTVPYAWTTFGGASAMAAGYVLHNRDQEHADKLAKLPINEQKAAAFEEGHVNQKKKEEALTKFPDLKEAFEAYDQARAKAEKLYPEPSNHGHSFEGQYGGQSEASGKRASYSFQASQAIYDALKKGDPIPHQQDQHSSLQGEKLTPTDLSIVLQQMASRNPDAALAYAQYLSNNQAQKTMQAAAPEAQV